MIKPIDFNLNMYDYVLNYLDVDEVDIEDMGSIYFQILYEEGILDLER